MPLLGPTSRSRERWLLLAGSGHEIAYRAEVLLAISSPATKARPSPRWRSQPAIGSGRPRKRGSRRAVHDRRFAYAKPTCAIERRDLAAQPGARLAVIEMAERLARFDRSRSKEQSSCSRPVGAALRGQFVIAIGRRTTATAGRRRCDRASLSAARAAASPSGVRRYSCRRGRPAGCSSSQHASTSPRSTKRTSTGYRVPDRNPSTNQIVWGGGRWRLDGPTFWS